MKNRRDVSEYRITAMPRFFVRPEDIADGRVTISGDDAKHIAKSLRMRAGEELTVCDAHSREYLCEIETVLNGEVSARIISESAVLSEPPYRAYLYQSLPKGDKMEYIVQKAVEIGVYRIIPLVSERSISRPDQASCAKKVERWNRIALEAAKQCGRGIIPTVSEVVTYKEAVRQMSELLSEEGSVSFLCYEGSGTEKLGAVAGDGSYKDIAFLIGPEGGISHEETELARQNGIKLAGLGKRILRCETASGFVLSCLAYENELRQ